MWNQVRTRFAPSPTGIMHLGGARTALFNYLFARHFNGKFLVRIEDTDIKRNLNSSIQQLLFDLKWLNMKIDATVDHEDDYGPYQQSKRLDFYHRFAQQLLTLKKVYPCFCSADELKAERLKQIANGQKAPRYNRKCLSLSPIEIDKLKKVGTSFCLRFYVEKGKDVVFQDLIYGNVNTKRQYIEDFVIIKTNNYPTYNFAVVVDDHLMKISHVWRGSDHLSNTAKQILLYETLNWKIPFFGHLNLIQFRDQKMSKRLGFSEQYINYYRDKGYLSSSVVNYLSFLGWTPDKFKELFTLSQLIELFNGKNLNKDQSTFNISKLKWINNKKIINLSEEEFNDYINLFVQKKTQELFNDQNSILLSNLKVTVDEVKKLFKNPQLKEIIIFFRKEIVDFDNLFELLSRYFIPKYNYEIDKDNILKNNFFLFKTLQDFLIDIDWNEKDINEMLKKIQIKTQLKGRAFFAPLYFLMINQTEGPIMSVFMFLFGKKIIQQQLDKYFKIYNNENKK